MGVDYELIKTFKAYITSGNDVPITRATLPAELISNAIYHLENDWSDGYDEGYEAGYEYEKD